jgi:hypothetical protein
LFTLSPLLKLLGSGWIAPGERSVTSHIITSGEGKRVICYGIEDGIHLSGLRFQQGLGATDLNGLVELANLQFDVDTRSLI